MKYKHHAVKVWEWLDANLGRKACAEFSGSDGEGLEAALLVAKLWLNAPTARRAGYAAAFAMCVTSMRPQTQAVCFHVVAMVGDWEHRQVLWKMAGLTNDNVIAALWGPETEHEDRAEVAQRRGIPFVRSEVVA